MDLIRKKSIVVDVLFILSILVGVLSIDPVIDDLNNLEKISFHAKAILVRAFMQFLLAIIYVSIPVVLYSLFKKINPGLTIGFLVFRIISAVFIFMGWLSILLLLALSEEFVKAGSPDLSHYQVLDNLLRSGRDLINHVAMPLILSVGNFMFYAILHQWKLVPRWLSLWGFIATGLGGVLASLLLMFGIIDIITPVYVGLAFPTALLEMVLAIWLITKGFSINLISI